MIRGPLDDKYEDYHLRICKVMCFRRMAHKMGYFIHMALLWQMEFNSFLFFFVRHTMTLIFTGIGKLMIYFITFCSSFCYSFAECAKILEGFPQDTTSKTYCYKKNITSNTLFISTYVYIYR